MKKLLALLLCLMLMTACAETVTGTVIDDFSVTLPDGSVFTLSEALSEYECVVINMWASWCPWCIKEFPYLSEAYAEYSDRIALICLSPDDENSIIPAFMEYYGITGLPMCYDSAGIASVVVQRGYPTTVAIGPGGKCIYYHCGALMTTDSVRAAFDKMLELAAAE